ncbi:MAG TPA: deferrochelatase/peroxidase EfeB, partial [Streptosporangiaceae bacterium]
TQNGALGLGGTQNSAPAFAGEPQNAPAVPFYGEHQAGIINPPPMRRQAVGNFAAFDVTAADRSELTDLFRVQGAA